jgi:hypothetical protein
LPFRKSQLRKVKGCLHKVKYALRQATRLDLSPQRLDSWSAMIDPDELRQAFLSLAVEVPEPHELGGVTFHGFSSPLSWVAFLSAAPDNDAALACEGWGATPFEALRALRRHMREEHPEEFGALRP